MKERGTVECPVCGEPAVGPRARTAEISAREGEFWDAQIHSIIGHIYLHPGKVCDVSFRGIVELDQPVKQSFQREDG